MLQIEHGIFLLGVLVVFGGSVNESSLLQSCAGRVEKHLLNVAVRYILGSIEVAVVCGNLDTALPTG